MKHGKGIFYFVNRDVYMGCWKEDKFYGDGMYVYSNGEKYCGKFVDGKKCGRGTYYYCGFVYLESIFCENI